MYALIKTPCFDSISMPKGHGLGLTPYKGAKLTFRKGKLEKLNHSFVV